MIVYTINGIHEDSISLPNGSWKNEEKSKSVMKKSFLSKIIEPNGYTTT